MEGRHQLPNAKIMAASRGVAGCLKRNNNPQYSTIIHIRFLSKGVLKAAPKKILNAILQIPVKHTKRKQLLGCVCVWLGCDGGHVEHYQRWLPCRVNKISSDIKSFKYRLIVSIRMQWCYNPKKAIRNDAKWCQVMPSDAKWCHV